MNSSNMIAMREYIRNEFYAGKTTIDAPKILRFFKVKYFNNDNST
jgi:hypothetical protein